MHYYLLHFIVLKYLKIYIHKLSYLSRVYHKHHHHCFVIIYSRDNGSGILRQLRSGPNDLFIKQTEWVTKKGLEPRKYYRVFPRHCAAQPPKFGAWCGHPLSYHLAWKALAHGVWTQHLDIPLGRMEPLLPRARPKAGLEGALASFGDCISWPSCCPGCPWTNLWFWKVARVSSQGALQPAACCHRRSLCSTGGQGFSERAADRISSDISVVWLVSLWLVYLQGWIFIWIWDLPWAERQLVPVVEMSVAGMAEGPVLGDSAGTFSCLWVHGGTHSWEQLLGA